ncbi:MAG TPA: VIT family protein [Drouetiella sp.]|jgi:vacuolar iron transporter family protein
MRIHNETHKLANTGWLRAAVLGGNDGIVSTSSLVLGIAAAHGTQHSAVIAAVASLVAGALSMAAGEYVSVSVQAESERSSLKQEKLELEQDPVGELKELTNIYISRGLTPELAKQVAEQLMAKDDLGSHARDELGISEAFTARPMLAAFVSGCGFSLGSALPLTVTIFSPPQSLQLCICVFGLVFLAVLGAVSTRLAGSTRILHGVIRLTLWSALAMLVTSLVGMALGTTAP